ncbi:transcription initiation factor TFIID subunit 2-like [Styela clava]
MEKAKSLRQSYQRPFKLSHQVLCITSINFSRKALMGYVELLIQPRRSDLKTIKVNSKQSRIYKVSVNDYEAPFQYHDPSLDLTQRDPIARNLEFLKSCHCNAVNVVDPDTGYHGEVTIKLPAEVQKLVKDQKALRISMDFTLENPNGGVQFVVPDVEGTTSEKAMHLFTYGHENSARLWFPCVDTYSEPCTWKLEFTVDATMTAVSVGELVETVFTPDMKRKTFHYILTVPTAAPNIGLAVGPFEVLVDKHMHEVTHFCLPQLLPLLEHTTQACYEVFEFYEEILSFRFPYSCYKQVFVDEAYRDIESYASLGIFNTNLLHSKIILDQNPETRKQMAKMISNQFFGCFMARESWNDLWLPTGLSAYLQGLWVKNIFGNNEYKHLIASETKKLCHYEMNVQPVTLCYNASHDSADSNTSLRNPHTMSPKYYEMLQCKSHLVMRMIENSIGPQLLLQALNKLLSLANTSAQQKVPNSTWVAMLLSTESFLKSINTVSGKKIDHLMNQWVYQSGVVCFKGRFTFNRKRNAVELDVKQHTGGKGIRKYVGPLTVRIQELDGSFQHTIQVEENTTKHDIQCHSKSRRNKRKKIPLLNGEEADIDLSAMDPDSPVLWLRIDPDLSVIRNVSFEQPDYMWQYQVRFERDIIGQAEALSVLSHFPSPPTRKALTDILENEKYFYRVRMEAAFCMAKVANAMISSWAGPPAMLTLFTRFFFCESTPPIVRMNNFTNLQQYFMQKTLPVAMANLRDTNNVCPKEVLHFLIDLIKFNDNSKSKVSDNYYRAALVESLCHLVTPTMSNPGQKVTVENLPLDVRMILEEISRFLNLEKLLSSYRYTVTVSCLKAIQALQRNGHLPPDYVLLRSYAAHGFFVDIRIAAIEALVDMIKATSDVDQFEWLLDLCEKDPVPEIKWRILKAFVSNPPFTKSDSQTSSLNTEHFVDKLWNFISKTTYYDSRIRCEAINLYNILFGTHRPKCLPPKDRRPSTTISTSVGDRASSTQGPQSKLKRTASTSFTGNSHDKIKMKIKFGNTSVDEGDEFDNADVMAAESLLSLSHSDLPTRPPTPGTDQPGSSWQTSPFVGSETSRAIHDSHKRPSQDSAVKDKKKKKKHKHKHRHKYKDGDLSSPSSSHVGSPMNLGISDSPKL